MKPEQRVQAKFSIRWAAAALALLAAIAAFDYWLGTFPDRQEYGWRTARIAKAPIVLDAAAFAPFHLAGAWRLTSDDPRFGGISALATEDGELVALSDSGVVIRFAPAGGSARIGELPDGPESNRFKLNRDSEGLVADPGGRGWWVAFEVRDELWLYDRSFARALGRIPLGDQGWWSNRGIEGAAAADGNSLLLLHEDGKRLIRVDRRQRRAMPIAGARTSHSDALSIGEGRWLVVERQLTPFGFRNFLAVLERTGGQYQLGPRFRLPLGRFDNVEALALEELAGGGRRLWLMTDDNFQPLLMRTILVALDVPPSDVLERRGKN